MILAFFLFIILTAACVFGAYKLNKSRDVYEDT